MLPAPTYQAHLLDGQKCIFITGAASGIGLATARLFSSRGWFVGLYDVSVAALEDAATQMKAPCCFESCDVADLQSVTRAVAHFAQATGGHMHCLFNCAGILRVGMMDEMDLVDQLAQVRVNLDGTVLCTHAALPHLRSTPGSVVINMSSLSASYGVPTHAVYAATKSAVCSLTESLSLEFERFNVRVCDVVVEYVKTPMITASDKHVPKTSRLLTDGQAWVSPDNVGETVWSAANARRKSELRRLHFAATSKAWFASKAVHLDNLLGLSLSPEGVRRLAMDDVTVQSRL